MIYDPTDGVSTLSRWWGLSAPETLRAMSAVAQPLVESPMPDRSRGRSQTKMDILVLQVKTKLFRNPIISLGWME
jgi:hypothetical protein